MANEAAQTKEDGQMKAAELQLGDRVKMSDGEYVEVIDLQAARLGSAVAIFTEEDEAPIIAPTNATVTTERMD